jgi:hypothetical protein
MKKGRNSRRASVAARRGSVLNIAAPKLAKVVKCYYYYYYSLINYLKL